VSGDAANLWADVTDWCGVGARRLVRAHDGSLGGSIWEFQPGGSQFVYHFHHGVRRSSSSFAASPLSGCTTVNASSARET
jgi:hypothetical protein